MFRTVPLSIFPIVSTDELVVVCRVRIIHPIIIGVYLGIWNVTSRIGIATEGLAEVIEANRCAAHIFRSLSDAVNAYVTCNGEDILPASVGLLDVVADGSIGSCGVGGGNGNELCCATCSLQGCNRE